MTEKINPEPESVKENRLPYTPRLVQLIQHPGFKLNEYLKVNAPDYSCQPFYDYAGTCSRPVAFIATALWVVSLLKQARSSIRFDTKSLFDKFEASLQAFFHPTPLLLPCFLAVGCDSRSKHRGFRTSWISHAHSNFKLSAYGIQVPPTVTVAEHQQHYDYAIQAVV